MAPAGQQTFLPALRDRIQRRRLFAAIRGRRRARALVIRFQFNAFGRESKGRAHGEPDAKSRAQTDADETGVPGEHGS